MWSVLYCVMSQESEKIATSKPLLKAVAHAACRQVKLGLNVPPVIISLFSMAGVPPFWGFFSKIFLFTLLANSNFFILFPFFFILLFIGLYFYIQNIRFLNSTSGANFTPIVELNARNVPMYYYLTFTLLFFLTFGVYFTEDLLILTQWILF